MALDAALGLPGSRPGAVTSLTRPTNPFQGQVIVETDTNTALFYTTNGWVELGRAVTVGAEPTSPVEGDLWYDGVDLSVYDSLNWQPAFGGLKENSVTSFELDTSLSIQDLVVQTLAVNGTIRIATSAPATSIGSSGDIAGTISWDATYLYVCTANYDGATAVWKRLTLETW